MESVAITKDVVISSTICDKSSKDCSNAKPLEISSVTMDDQGLIRIDFKNSIEFLYVNYKHLQ